MGTAVLSDHSPSHFNALYSLVFQKSYDVRELQLQLAYQQWTENDDFQMLLIQPDYLQNSYRSVEILYSILLHNLPSCVIFRKDPYILVLSNQLLEKRQNLLDFLSALHENNKIRASFSLGAKGTAEIPWMVQQCLFAIKAAESESNGQWLYYFEKYAVDYMLFHARGSEQIHACHPMIRKLWDEKEKNEDELFKTLLIYLDNERSVNKTSAALFTHRNTVMYRIRKLQETYSLNLDDPGTRYYLRLSMQVLSSPVRMNTQFFSGPQLNSIR
jgi:sugar diacid utilization regulator